MFKRKKKAQYKAPLLKAQGHGTTVKPEWAYAERGSGRGVVKSKPRPTPKPKLKQKPKAPLRAEKRGDHCGALASDCHTSGAPLTAVSSETEGKKGKRLVVTIIIKNTGEVFESVLSQKLGFLYPFCCLGGVFDVSSGTPQYCACCCVRATEPQITAKVAKKISDKLAATGIVNEVQIVKSTTNAFRIIVRKMNTLVTKAARGILEKKLNEALTKEGIEFTLSVKREEVIMYKKTVDLKQHKQKAKEKAKKRKK